MVVEMLSRKQARRLADEYLAVESDWFREQGLEDDDLVVLPSLTEALPYGWVFYFLPRRLIARGKPKERVPIGRLFVDKQDATLEEIATKYSLTTWRERHEAKRREREPALPERLMMPPARVVELGVFRDGGTIFAKVIDASKRVFRFCIDRRIGLRNPGRLYVGALHATRSSAKAMAPASPNRCTFVDALKRHAARRGRGRTIALRAIEILANARDD